MSTNRQHRIRRRPVSYGNPGLYEGSGSVYTLEYAGSKYQHQLLSPIPVVEHATSVDRTVSMVGVPPDQVPEGILNLARAHQPWIRHVRIFVQEPRKSNDGGDDDNNDNTEPDHGSSSSSHSNQSTPTHGMTAMTTEDLIAVSPSLSAAQSAASMLAKEQDDEEQKTVTAISSASNDEAEGNTDSPKSSPFASDEAPDPNQRSYLVLFEMDSEETAEQIIQDLHGQPYTWLDESVRCSMYHVVAVLGGDGVRLQSSFFSTSESGVAAQNQLVESLSTAQSSQNDTNCPVCLEQLHLHDEEEHQPIFTTVCNHSFHLDCIMKCQDSPCPVCRYDHSGLNDTLSQCHKCGTTENNYVCLICGVVSCGGGTSAGHSNNQQLANGGNGTVDTPQCTPAAVSGETGIAAATPAPTNFSGMSHARSHYDETLHAYALDTENQHVWDFAGGGFVHRLLQNKDDGKLVEIADPDALSEERTLNPGLSETQEEHVVHRKLEGLATSYYTLLKSQLEQQRIFYEERLEEIHREYEEKRIKEASSRPKNAADLIAALKQERQQLSQRLVILQSRRNKVKEDVSFLTTMIENLESNRTTFREDVAKAQREREDVRIMFENCLPPLQEKVTRLMLQLESEAAPPPSHDESKKPAARRSNR